MRLTSIEGIGTAYGKNLEKLNIETQEQLLEKGATHAGRKQIAEKTGISEKLVLKWVNRADLARIKGIGEEYADLLEHAGVDTVPELAQRNAENLFARIEEVNTEKHLVRHMPSHSQVSGWIEEAKKLPRVITY